MSEHASGRDPALGPVLVPITNASTNIVLDVALSFGLCYHRPKALVSAIAAVSEPAANWFDRCGYGLLIEQVI